MDQCQRRCFEFEMGCRNEIRQQSQQLAELGQLVAELLARPRLEPKGALAAAQAHTRLDQQDLLVEQLDARLWALAEGQARLEKQSSAGASDSCKCCENTTLLPPTTEDLRSRAKRHLAQTAQCRQDYEDIVSGQVRYSIEATRATAAEARGQVVCDMAAASESVALPLDFSNALEALEVRLNTTCTGLERRCDALQSVVDLHLQKACNWLPAVEERVEKLAAQCQDGVMRTEAQEMQFRGLRSEHDASCRRLLVLADQVAGLVDLP